MKTKIQGIYKIRNCINGKVYIGQSIDIEYRLQAHKSNAKDNYKHPLYDSIRCYGIENFEFITIEEVEDINSLDIREQYWMDHYQCYNLEFGYNLRSKAESNRGYKHTEESKKKNSDSKKGKIHSKEVIQKMIQSRKWYRPSKETIQKIIQSRKGYKHSDETKKKLSIKHKGKVLTDEHKRNMSLSRKGKKRCSCSEETKRKISLALKGRPGCKHTEQYKLKMSLLNKDKKVSEETRRRISLSNKGKISWNTGLTYTYEERRKIALSKKEINLTRKRLSIEDIQKLSQNNIIQFKRQVG